MTAELVKAWSQASTATILAIGILWLGNSFVNNLIPLLKTNVEILEEQKEVAEQTMIALKEISRTYSGK